jgi:hypothetical protein
MANESQINAVVDAIVKAFDGDAQLFEAFLLRARLETDAEKLRSRIRNQQAKRDKAVDSAETSIQSLQADLQAKIAEIDAL